MKKSLNIIILILGAIVLIGLYFKESVVNILIVSVVTLCLVQLCLFIGNNLKKKNKKFQVEEMVADKENDEANCTENGKVQAQKSKITVKKELRKNVNDELGKIKYEFIDESNKIANDYMSSAIKGVVEGEEAFTVNDIIDSVSDAVENTYKDVYSNVRNKVAESNEDLISSIENKVKDYVTVSDIEDSILMNIEINEVLDESISLYNREINHLLTRQQDSLKSEINSSINKQLYDVKENIKSANIDFVALEGKLRTNTKNIMEEYSKKNEEQVNKILKSISEEFGDIHEQINYEKLSDDIKRDLEEFEESYINATQKSIDYTLDLVKTLGSMGIKEFKIIRRQEIKEIFKRSLLMTKNEIDIASLCMTNQVMFKEKIFEELKRNLKENKNIKIKIIYGTNDSNLDEFEKASDKVATILLEDFSNFKNNFKLIKKECDKAILVCDDNIALIGNFNFLGYKGKGIDKIDGTDEIAALITNKEMVKRIRRQMFSL